MTKVPVQFILNGDEQAQFIEGGTTVLQLLRTEIGDMSPKTGCAQGTCGACTVLVDGQAHLSCLLLAEDCQGRSVQTLRGLANASVLDPIQQAFIDNFAAQCGFCTAGMIMAAKALLANNSKPTREDVIEAISGNVCRCTGYEPIIAAVLDAAERCNKSSDDRS